MSDRGSRQAKAAVVLCVCLVAVGFAVYRIAFAPSSAPTVEDEIRDKAARMAEQQASANATTDQDDDEPVTPRADGPQPVDG